MAVAAYKDARAGVLYQRGEIGPELGNHLQGDRELEPGFGNPDQPPGDQVRNGPKGNRPENLYRWSAEHSKEPWRVLGADPSAPPAACAPPSI